MRTSINYSSYTSTTYYAVGRDSQLSADTVFDKFIAAVGKYKELNPFIESNTEDSIMFRIPNENADIQILINKIAMLAYQGCVYRDDEIFSGPPSSRKCRTCQYKTYCDVVNGPVDTNKIVYKAYNEGFKDGVDQGIKLSEGCKEE